MDIEILSSIVESILFVSEKPVSIEKLQEAVENVDKKKIESVVSMLSKRYEDTGSGIRLEAVAGGYQLRSKEENSLYVKRFLKHKPLRFSKAALETLAITAYKQPITRQEIESIRGVESSGILKLLLEKRLIKIFGKKDVPGRPMIYGTTREFLEIFSLNSIKDLPTLKEIEELLEKEMDESSYAQPPLIVVKD